MSTRIETANHPIALLRELPAGWAQMILTSPSQADLEGTPAALFTECHRVLRDDGTLWLLSADKQLPSELARRGWLLRTVDWATPLRVDPAGRTRLHLLVKHPRYYYNRAAAELFLKPRTRIRFTRTSRRHMRRQGCAWSPEHRQELMRMCILAGSSRIACGTCGAPYARARHGDERDIRRATCIHRNPLGRCLVLDPFYHPGTSAPEIANRYGRSFLGITSQAATGETR
jgi:hypothetical protein